MKLTKIITFSALLLSAPLGFAQTAHVWDNPHDWWGAHFVYGPTAPDKYTAQELSVDAFASYMAGQSKLSHVFQTDIRSGIWGGGVGVNYFFLRELGISGDIIIADNGGHFVDSMNGSLVARWPFETTGLAPYIFGGGGRRTDPIWEWTGHAGLGFEFRVNPVTGIFLDTRYVWADKTSADSIVFRTGLRLVF
jgi:hypothetical protein